MTEQDRAEVVTPEDDQPVVIPETTEIQEVQVENVETLKSKLLEQEKRNAELERLHADDTKRITEQKKERRPDSSEKLAVQLERQEKLTELNFSHQQGTLDAEGYARAKQQLDADYRQRTSALAYAAYASEMAGNVEDILEGIDDPGGKSLKEDFQKSTTRGEPLEKFITQASKLAKAQAKGTQVDINKLKEEWKKEALEEKKKSLKVDTSSPAGSNITSSKAELNRKYAEGEISYKEYGEGLKKF